MKARAVRFRMFLTAIVLGLRGADGQAPLLDVFPSSPRPQGDGAATISKTFTPTDSLWMEGLDERNVFQAEMRHLQGPHDSFALRVGRGGQIYSLRGAFGESLPPSYRSGGPESPWNDEVWQFVSVCTTYNGLDALKRAGAVPPECLDRMARTPYARDFFIHNSGAYSQAGDGLPYLYCPQLAESVSADGRVYRTLNWGLVPQMRTLHRSPILYYTQVRDAGDGIIELTWAVHNFSPRPDVVFDHLNAPWGGTRATSLPLHAISLPGGGVVPREQMFHQEPDRAVEIRKMGGWSVASAREGGDAPSLALVFGRDKRLDEQIRLRQAGQPHFQTSASVVRNFRAHYPQMYEHHWQDWQTRPANSFRNYDVIEFIPRARIVPGATFWFRSYLVVNRRDRCEQLAASLADQVDYGLLAFAPATTPMVPVFLREGRVAEDGGAPAFRLYAHPVPGSRPLFLLEDTTTGREVITSDPYLLVPSEPLELGVPEAHPHHDYYARARGYAIDRHTCRWKRLLGYGLLHAPGNSPARRLSEACPPPLTPATTAFHEDVWVLGK